MPNEVWYYIGLDESGREIYLTEDEYQQLEQELEDDG